MGSTMTQKLLAAKCGKEEVKPGQLIMCLSLIHISEPTRP